MRIDAGVLSPGTTGACRRIPDCLVVKGPAQGDGADPGAGLLRDPAGNLYGTTTAGGANDDGTVFKLAPDGTESVLYSFKGGTDGAGPESQLITDAVGNFYCTTEVGGTGTCGVGCGTVFKLAPDGTETVLYSFAYNGKDGFYPRAGLVMDKAGNLFGTTQAGGQGTGECSGNGCGTVFEITSGGKEKILHSFNGPDGQYPYYGSLILDKAGNLFGTTGDGGADGVGVIFEIPPDGNETVLHSCNYDNELDCVYPYGGLSIDGNGNLFGSSEEGGYRSGDIFEVAPDGTFTELYEFGDGADSMYPDSGVILDKSGNLYGTTQGTAGKPCKGCAAIFRLAPDGTETTMHSFVHKTAGLEPLTELIDGGDGYLYGTTVEGGKGESGKHCGLSRGPSGCGTVFRIKK